MVVKWTRDGFSLRKVWNTLSRSVFFNRLHQNHMDGCWNLNSWVQFQNYCIMHQTDVCSRNLLTSSPGALWILKFEKHLPSMKHESVTQRSQDAFQNAFRKWKKNTDWLNDLMTGEAVCVCDSFLPTKVWTHSMSSMN